VRVRLGRGAQGHDFGEANIDALVDGRSVGFAVLQAAGRSVKSVQLQDYVLYKAPAQLLEPA
jgi:hypothetical protein